MVMKIEMSQVLLKKYFFLYGELSLLVHDMGETLALLIVTPIVGFCNCSMFCFSLLCFHSSFVIILVGKRLRRFVCLPGFL